MGHDLLKNGWDNFGNVRPTLKIGSRMSLGNEDVFKERIHFQTVLWNVRMFVPVVTLWEIMMCVVVVLVLVVFGGGGG